MDRVWGPVTSYRTLPTLLLQYAAPQPRARHRSCHLQITKSWLLTRTAAQKPECQRAPAKASIRLFKWFETVGKRRRAGRGGSLPRSPDVDRAPIFNGMEKKKKRKKWKKMRKGVEEAGAWPAHPSFLRKVRIFVGGIGKSSKIADAPNSRVFSAAMTS